MEGYVPMVISHSVDLKAEFPTLKAYFVDAPSFLDHSGVNRLLVTKSMTAQELSDFTQTYHTYLYPRAITREDQPGVYHVRLCGVLEMPTKRMVDRLVVKERVLDDRDYDMYARVEMMVCLGSQDIEAVWGINEVARQIGRQVLDAIAVAETEQRNAANQPAAPAHAPPAP